jgi:betaine-aldehyde dehydrogenase
MMSFVCHAVVRARKANDKRFDEMGLAKLNALNWIGGEWVDSKNRLDSINPATGETIGTYANGGEAEAMKAIGIAKQVFLDSDWRENRRLRAKVLNQMAERFEAGMDDLVDVLALENGKITNHSVHPLFGASACRRMYGRREAAGMDRANERQDVRSVCGS